ncbi:hypothetical protein PT974_05632 [Cladobotryum mycophilum]|uniref:C3H1-type domain-containing protein n=1 Tax=Cladobotryum mycophilum TaxID=491253 RepID=A0ABR0SJ93_9HYPO
MQSWPSSGQNGANDGHNSWQSNFTYAGQNGQFDPSQSWSQPGTEQTTAYSHLNPQDASSSNFFDAPHQGNAFLAGNIHNTPSTQPAFHTSAIALNQQYSQPGQDVIDPAFSSIHTDLYGHQPRVSLATEGIGHMAQVQNHPHAHSQTFSQHDFSFPPQNDQPFDSSVSYSQAQLLPQTARQDSHTPVQQHFDSLHGSFTQNHRYSRPPQQTPVQHQQAQPYTQEQAFAPAINGQAGQYQVNNAMNYQQTGQPYTSQPGYTQQQKPLAYSQASQNPPVQQLTTQPLQHASTLPTSHGTPTASSTPVIQYSASQKPLEADAGGNTASKRKRVSKGSPEVTPSESIIILSEGSGDVPDSKKTDDTDALPIPLPSDEELQLMNQFAKRNKVAQARFPSIKGLHHLVYDGSIKLPGKWSTYYGLREEEANFIFNLEAPKSYDKLSPFVALPSRSGRPMVPELGYNLPCEIQGRFTSQYRPSIDKGGLDERRVEAKFLLDDYDRSMNGLGKRRPKYTEYPHAFKEQLKSDEASRNKAEKRAKKEMEDERVKPIRAATRPTNPVEAAAWDAIGIVHIEPAITRTSAIVAGRVQNAGDFFIKLRNDMNRSKLEVDQAVKDKVPEADLDEIKKEAEDKKEAFYRALDATIEHADDAVLDNLGGHQKLVLSLVNVMIGSIKAGDFSGKLPKALLELFTHFRMTKKIAETTNFETVRKRFEDKGDDEVKEMAREIAASIKKVTKGAEAETSTGYTGTSAASRAKAGVKGAPDSSSAKRGRDDDSDSRTVKKIAVESGSGSLSKKLAQPKTQPQALSKPAAAKPSISSLLPGKARPVAKPVPKSEASSADSPSTSADDKGKPETKKLKPEPTKATASKTESRAPVSKPASSTSSSALSGIASLLDAINAPKPEVAASTKDTKGSETPEAPEERAKRLRKEARHKLRVTWKPEAELVQVKIFQKDDQEDEGREVNMIRDAADDRSEGMVLKQRANVEEEDDDDDIPYQPWLGPVATDFSSLPEDVRSKNYVTRGGNVTFTTDEQRRIAEREQRELMAIYTDLADIPPTPKSPLPEMATTDVQTKIAYLPREGSKFDEIQLRWRDEQQFGLDDALRASVRRLDAKHSPSNQLDSILGRLQENALASAHAPQASSSVQGHQAPAYTNVPLLVGARSEEQVLGWITSDKMKAWHRTVRLTGTVVESVVKSLLGKPFPANSPPEWILSDEERIREWWFAYNKEVTARQKREEEERAKAEAEANALQAVAAAAAATANQTQNNTQDWTAYYAQQQYAPYMALLQQMTGGQHQPAQQPPSAATAAAAAAPPPQQQQSQIPDNQLQSILAAINQPSQQSAQIQAAANATSYLNPNDPSYQQLLMLTQMAQGQQPPQPPPNHGGDRDWDRNEGSRSDAYKDGKDSRKKKGTLPPHKPANKALIGTKPCTFWQQGKCARGDKCTFRHG